MTLLSKFDPQDSISSQELDTGLRWLLWSNVSGKMMYAVTSLFGPDRVDDLLRDHI